MIGLKVTLKDIAQQLDISISTVSRALKNNPRIGDFTREKVIRKAREMGYFQDVRFDMHSREHTNLIGVIVPSIRYHLYARAISGMEDTLEKKGMHLVVCQSNESYEREKVLVEKLMQMGVNGIIISLASETQNFFHFEKIKQNGIPLVFFNRECNEVNTHKVTIDNQRAACEAVEHLISVGCTRIAYLGGPEVLQINAERIKGYKKALKNANLPIEEDRIVFSRFDRQSTLSAARRLLYTPNHPDGILTFSDQIAVSVMLAAKERGIAMPKDLSVIGFNNEPVDEFLEPSLTSIEQPGFAMGATAAKMLLQRSAELKEDYEKRILKSYLVVRNSTNKNKTDNKKILK